MAAHLKKRQQRKTKDDKEESLEDENETSKTNKKRIDNGKKLAVPAGRRGEPRRRHSGKLTISQALDDSGVERVRSLASVRRAREKEKNELAKSKVKFKSKSEMLLYQMQLLFKN